MCDRKDMFGDKSTFGKYRDSNMFRNHFCFLNARMVQSVESVWTGLL